MTHFNLKGEENCYWFFSKEPTLVISDAGITKIKADSEEEAIEKLKKPYNREPLFKQLREEEKKGTVMMVKARELKEEQVSKKLKEV